MLITKTIEQLLGDDESRIIRVISKGYGDIDSIWLLTGIPEDCIIAKIAALERLGWISRIGSGYVLSSRDAAINPATRRKAGKL